MSEATPAKKAKATVKASSLHEAGLESFVVEELHRSKLSNATYNPRKINDKERDKLKAALQRHGLVAPITWNKRTGNIVGGHQRISIMDTLMKTADYKLSVAVIDCDEAREKELNILLNNQQAMGSWDMAALKDMFADEDVSLAGAGFDLTDMIQMFGDDSVDDRQEDLSELAQKLSEISSLYSGAQAKNKKKFEEENFLVLVFENNEQLSGFVEHFKGEDNRYQNGVAMMKQLGIKPKVDDDDATA